jgi:hypothetical protein
MNSTKKMRIIYWAAVTAAMTIGLLTIKYFNSQVNWLMCGQNLIECDTTTKFVMITGTTLFIILFTIGYLSGRFKWFEK